MSESKPDEVSYPSYLALDELLSLQRPRSQPVHPGELLFIIVHQASELWFKVILHELDAVVASMRKFDAQLALWHVGRLNVMMRIVSSQLSSLELLPPQHFLEFRGFLGTSSGSQSLQFRAIEAASGLREPHFIAALEAHGPIPPQVQKYLDQPTLQDLLLALIEHEGTDVKQLYVGPGPTTLFFLAEGFLEYEQGFAEWRFKHVQLVERVIGPSTGGTGGTLGARYLAKTVSQRFFPKLWEARGEMFVSG
ncbi:MAG: tryptophan 2,3-dioxygenase family protein [Gemmatimonadaceae bacterium]